MCPSNRRARGVLRSVFLSESRRSVRGGREQTEEWPCEGKQNRCKPQYGRRSWRSVNKGPACDGTQKRARKRQAGWYRRSVQTLVPAAEKQRQGFFFCLTFSQLRNSFRNWTLALIAAALGRFGRREASRSSAQGVFKAAKLPQKRILIPFGALIQACSEFRN